MGSWEGNSPFSVLLKIWVTGLLTFTAGDSRAPDHISILQDAGDGLRTLGLHKAIVTVKGHRTSQQKPVSKTPSIHRNSRVMTLVLTKC